MKPRMIALAVAAVTATWCLEADDLSAPSWRGQPRSTFQEWTFSSNPGASLPPYVQPPEVNVNPYGTATATVTWDQYGSGWYESDPTVYGSKQGFWDIGRGSITLQVPNNPSAGAAFTKEIQLQVTYWRDFHQAPTVTVSPFASQVGATITTLVLNPPGTGEWYSDLYVFHLSTSPISESITLFGNTSGSIIDQIVLDTVSVPEPSALASGVVLALSAVIASRRRRA